MVFAGISKIPSFRFDDPIHLHAYAPMQTAGWNGFRQLWTANVPGGFTPVTHSVWFALTHFVGGGEEVSFDPKIFYTANLVVYLATVLLIFLSLRLITLHDEAAFFGALLFALHPLHVEPVAWVTGMRDLLAGFFSAGCLLLYVQFVRKGGRGRYAAMVVAFLLAVLAKPTAFPLPIILGVIAVIFLGRSAKKVAVDFGPWAVFLPLLVYQTSAQAGFTARLVPEIPFTAKVLVALDALSFYFGKILFPLPLGFDYGRTPAVVLSQSRILWVPLLPVLFIFYLFTKRKLAGARIALACVGIFVAAVATALGLRPFIFQHMSTVADRYVYFALLGPALGVAWILSQHWKKTALRAAVVLAIALLGFRSWNEVRLWQDDHALYQRMVRVNPNSWLGYSCLASLHRRAKDVDGTAHYYKLAATSMPELAKRPALWNQLGFYLLGEGRNFEAVRALTNAVTLHLELGDRVRARESFSAALRLDPSLEASRKLLRGLEP